MPGQLPCPGSNSDSKCLGKAFLASSPWHLLNVNAVAPQTTYTAWRIGKVHVDSPDGYMAKVAFGQGVPIITSNAADPTAWVIAQIRFDSNK